MSEFKQTEPRIAVDTDSERERERELNERFLRQLRSFRFDYLDTLPDNIVYGDDPNYSKYKCRKGFWQGVGDTLSLASQELNFTPEVAARIEEFWNYIGNNIRGKPRITRENIDYVNATLDYFINSLS